MDSNRVQMRKYNTDDKEDTKECTSVLWEKRFQQTIFVDISDDDSLHFNHLQSSFTMCVSHDLAVSSENSGLSGSSKAVEDSSKSPSSISSQYRHYGNISDVQGNEMKVSASQPDRQPKQTRWTHEDDNTSDDDQEELPYDDELYRHVTHCSNSLRQNSNSPFNLIKKSNHCPDAFNTLRKDAKLPGCDISKTSGSVFEQKHHQTSIPDFLLRHFSYDELFNSSRLIEAETMPEVSLMDSLSETMRRASPNPHTNTGKHSVKINTSFLDPNRSERFTALDLTNLKTETAETGTHKNNNSDKVVNQSDSSENFNSNSFSHVYSSPGAVLMVTEDEVGDVENNVKQSYSSSPPDLHKVDIQTVKCSLGRTLSFSELKYGQRQVYYPQPDFSNVAPKVKFPKRNDVAKPACDSAMTRAQKTTGILSKVPSPCKADVISRVLEDFDLKSEKPIIFKDEMTHSSFHQDLQTQTTGPTFSNIWGKKEDIRQTEDNVRSVPHTFESTKAGLDEEKRNRNWSSVSEQKSPNEGYRLTIELKDIINQFMAQVEEFKICLNNMSLSVEEQQMVFKSLLEVQDQLEQNYMTKKEEHRALEMQNYMGLKRNIGTFDHDRLLEGEIFQLSMYLEDIKEQIDRNAYFVLSPSPTSTTPSLPPHGQHIPSSSVQPALQKESVSSKSRLMDKEEESYKDGYEVPGAVDSPPSCPRENSFSIYNKMSCIAREDENGSARVSEEEDNYKGIQTQLSNSVSPQHQSTPSRCFDKDCYSTKDWISSDTEHSKRKGADSGASDDNEVPDVFILSHRCPTNKISHALNNSFPVSLENLSLDTSQSRQGNNYWRATTFTGLNTIGNNASSGLPNHSRKNRNTGYMKPSSNLPSGFKVQDQQSEPGVTKIRCPFQSDSALLPSIFYFYKASTLSTYPSRTGCGVHRVKEEALNQTIDETLDAALMMKQVTDHMAKTLSSDLAMAQLYRKLREMA
ncbi:protein AKNAD1-like isoform X2 [Hemibagrus wyckioides]|nr:protein AKNAD1-like isoform X2 [Hemibagrus wyckioides]